MPDFTLWILSHGVSQEILEMMVFIPILATLVSLVRYVLGLKTFGIYAPIILAISYSLTGLRYGLILTAIVVLSTIVGYTALRRVRMHYITRIATNYVIVVMFVIIGIATFDWLPLGFDNFDAINPIGVVSIAALSDFFIKTYVKKSITVTMRTVIETTLVSIIGWYLITSEQLTHFLLENLWIIPAMVLVNLMLGQYRGLKFKDIFRFQSGVKNVSREDK